MTLELANPSLTELEPFVVAMPEVLETLDVAPFGFRVSAARRFEPLHLETTHMLDRLRALDELTFGSEGMPMARWILIDGAGLTGAIFGLGRRASQAAPEAREALGVAPGSESFVPYSMYIAIPSFEPATWVGHNLASLAAVPNLRRALHGLGSLTKALALKAFRAQYQIGAAQWDSPALRVHTRLGPLKLKSAWTPAHTKPWTYTYVANVTDAALRHLARDRRGHVKFLEPTRSIDSADHRAMQRLQKDIERGTQWCIAGPPTPLPAGDSGLDRRQRVDLALVPA